MWTFFRPNCDGEKPLSPLCGALYHGNLAKLITLSGSLCMLCVIFFLRSLVSLLFLFSLTGLKERLFSPQGHSLVVYLGFLSSSGCYGRFSQTHTLFLFYSIPSPQPASCLPSTAQHTQGTLQTELFWSQSNRKSMEEGFFFLQKEEGWTEKFAPKPCKAL